MAESPTHISSTVKVNSEPRADVGRKRPSYFRALGRAEPPAVIEVQGCTLQLVEAFKHDSWAATALYRGELGEVVVKFNRTQSFLGLPLFLIGRWLARREARLLTALQHLSNVPRLLGEVRVEGKPARTAVARGYIAGSPLKPKQWVNDAFCPKLVELVQEMHRVDIAYVDLHKCENIIVGSNGEPYLIDFQISYQLPKGFRGVLMRGWLRILQMCDRYHVQKHIIRHRPDLLPESQRDLDALRPWPIRLARMVGNRTRWFRRRLLVMLGIRKGQGRVESELEPEDAVRRILSGP